MNIKYKIGDDVLDLYDKKYKVSSIVIDGLGVNYNVWDGKEYDTLLPWQIKDVEGYTYIGFNISYATE